MNSKSLGRRSTTTKIETFLITTNRSNPRLIIIKPQHFYQIQDDVPCSFRKYCTLGVLENIGTSSSIWFEMSREKSDDIYIREGTVIAVAARHPGYTSSMATTKLQSLVRRLVLEL